MFKSIYDWASDRLGRAVKGLMPAALKAELEREGLSLYERGPEW